jgi:hypothetical protein
MKKTRKINGGGDSDLIDDNFVIENLYSILNSRPINFTFVVQRRMAVRDNNNRKTFAVITINKNKNNNNNIFDNFCLLFVIIKNTITNEYSIYIVSLEKCAPINKYGNFILDSIKEFAYKFVYYSIIIEVDASDLVFICDNDGKNKKVYISLAKLSILSTGESWYNRLGFYAPTNLDEKDANSLIIQKDIEDIDDLTDENDNKYINIFIEAQHKGKNPVIEPVLDSECLKIIFNYRSFRELYNFILKITKTDGSDSIQNVFLALNEFIRSNCDSINTRCKVDYFTMKKISCFIEFMFELLGIKYTRDNLEYIVPRYRYQKGRGKKIYMKNQTRKRKLQGLRNRRLKCKKM